MTRKEKIYDHYSQLLNNKIQSMQNAIAELRESGANETKSTVGDKHETAMAMLQIEQNNIRVQLNEAKEQKAIFERIDPTLSPDTIVNGSLIKTDKGYLFLSVALGKAMVDGKSVMALSQQSPLGKLLMGQTIGGTATVNGNRYVIENVE